MNRTEATAHIRSVGRTCRGKSLFTEEQRAQYADEGNAALAPHYNFEAANALKLSLEAKLGQYNAPARDSAEMAQRLVFLIYARPDVLGRPCGYDYNNFVEANPWDGKVYTTVCPQCGTEDKYQAPVYQIED